MKTASVTEAKNKLSELLDQVKHGHSIVITDHNCPVAQIGPIPNNKAWSDARLLAMARQGLVHLPSGKVESIPKFVANPKGRLKPASGTATAAILKERAEGR
jgi:prevent-host-death family protein